MYTFSYFNLAKYTEICPKFIGINTNYVAIASEDEILLWHYHTPKVSIRILKIFQIYKNCTLECVSTA